MATEKMSKEKEEFVKNYTGIFNASHYYDYLQEEEKNKQQLSNATYNNTTNRKLVKEANFKSFNKHMRFRG